MLKAQLIHLLIHYKYAILIPFGFIEGHIVSLASGFLSHEGYLNPFFAAICIIIGNLLGDVLLYWLGYHKGARFVDRYGKRFGITSELVARGRDLFHRHKSRVLLISKLTNGFGFAIGVLFSAGMVKIPFRTYMFWNILGECLWTGLLVTVGYIFGSAYGSVDSLMSKIFVVILLLVAMMYMFLKIRKAVISRFIK